MNLEHLSPAEKIAHHVRASFLEDIKKAYEADEQRLMELGKEISRLHDMQDARKLLLREGL